MNSKKVATVIAALPLLFCGFSVSAATYNFAVEFTQIEGEDPSDDTNGTVAKPGTLGSGDLTGFFTFDLMSVGTNTMRFRIFDDLTANAFVYDTGSLSLDSGAEFSSTKWEIKAGDIVTTLPLFVGPNGGFPTMKLEFKIEGTDFPALDNLIPFSGTITENKTKFEAKGLDEDTTGYLCGLNTSGHPNCNGKLTPKFGVVTANVSPVPLPAAVWLFGSGVLGFFGLGALSRRRRG